MSNKGEQEKHSLTQVDFGEFKINCSEFRDRYLNLENNFKASQEVERQTRNELNVIKAKLESILIKNAEQYMIYKSTQEKLEETIADLKESFLVVNKEMSRQEREIFDLKQMLCHTDVNDQSLQSNKTALKRPECSLETVECENNINEGSFFVLESNFEFPKRTSTAIKKPRSKRRRAVSDKPEITQKSFWDELRVGLV